MLLFAALIISVVTDAQQMTLVTGSQRIGTNALDLNLNSMNGMIAAPNGDLFISSGTAFLNIVRIDATTGEVSLVVGSGTLGSAVDGAIATMSPAEPSGAMALSTSGDLYYSDYSIISRINASTGRITHVAGFTDTGFSGDGGQAQIAALENVPSMVISGTKLFFISGSRIRMIDLTTNIITTVAGTGISGHSGDGGPATAAKIRQSLLTADNAGNLYITDPYDYVVRKIDATTGIITRFAGNTTFGDAGDGGQAIDAQLVPSAIFANGEYLYVADMNHHKVRRIHLTTNVITTFAGSGANGYAGDGGTALAATLSSPRLICGDDESNVFIGEVGNLRVRKVDGGMITTIAGAGRSPRDGGPAIDAFVAQPGSFDFTTNGDLVFHDGAAYRIRKIDKLTGIISTIAGTGTFGSTGDGGLAINATIPSSAVLAIDADDNIYVAANARVRKIDAASGIITTIAGTGVHGFAGDNGPAINAQLGSIRDAECAGDVLYLADNNRIRKIDLQTQTITTIAGTGIEGHSGDDGPSTSADITINDFDIKSNHDILIATGSGIRKVDGATGIITTIKNGYYITHIAVGPQDAIIYWNTTLDAQHLIRFDTGGGPAEIIAGNSNTGYAGDGGRALDADLPYPTAIKFDLDGQLFISSQLNAAIRKVGTRETQIINFSTPGPIRVDESVSIQSSIAYASSGLPLTFTTSDPDVVGVTGNILTAHRTGTATITAHQAGAFGYFPASAQQQITVEKGDRRISYTGPLHGRVGETITVDCDLNGASGTPQYSVTNISGAALLVDTDIQLLQTGIIEVAVTIDADEDYEATVFTQLIHIYKARPALTITSATSGAVGSTIALSSDTDGSTGELNYSVENIDGEAVIDGDQLALTTAGTVRLIATLDADDQFQTARTIQYVTITDASTPTMAQIWGTMTNGGAGNGGVIFRMNADGSEYRVIQQFINDGTGYSPMNNRPLHAPDGNIYGTLLAGGIHGTGVLYKYDVATESITVLHHFQSPNGYFPGSGLTFVDGTFYGTTSGGGPDNEGLLFQFDPATGELVVKHVFDHAPGGQSGTNPMREPRLGANGKLYGLTNQGGLHNGGTLYEYEPVAGTFSVIHHFRTSDGIGANPVSELVLAGNNKFYGATTSLFSRGIFEFDPETNTVTRKVNLDEYEQSGMVSGQDGNLYGLLSFGGSESAGQIMKYTPGASSITRIYDFKAKGNSRPNGFIVAPNGKFYGTRQFDATHPSVIFEFDPVSLDYNEVFRFTPSDGRLVGFALAVTEAGLIYGVSSNGGSSDLGTLFSFDTNQKLFRKHIDLHDGVGSHSPVSGLARSGDKIYGYAAGGGGNGTLFAFDMESNKRTLADNIETTKDRGEGLILLHTSGKLFSANNDSPSGNVVEYDPATGTTKKFPLPSSTPVGFFGTNLIEGANGTIYGCARGGANNNGVIFSFDPATGSFAVAHDFPARSAASEAIYVGLVFGPDDLIYGVSVTGGSNDTGTIFTFDPSTNDYEQVHEFVSPQHGHLPWLMVLAPNGKFYGNAESGGDNGTGVLYEFDPVQKTVTTKIHHAVRPEATQMVVGANGNIYGVSTTDGTVRGHIFEYNPSTNTLTQKKALTDETGYGPLTGWLLVKLKQNIQFEEISHLEVSQSPVALQGIASSGLPVTYTSSNPNVAVVTGNQLTILTTGTTVITATQTGDANYDAALPVSHTVAITSPQAIDFSPIEPKTFNDAPFALTATSSSGLPVTFTSSNPEVATISGNVVTIIGAGVATIVASQAGNNEYSSATMERELVVARAANSITFGTLPDRTLGDPGFQLQATSSSGLAVAYQSLSDHLNIAGTHVTLTRSGRAHIVASQTGNNNYHPAVDVEQSFCINPAKPTITSSGNSLTQVTLTSSNLTGNQWFRDGVLIDQATTNTLPVTISGNYTVRVTIEGCQSAPSDPFNQVITGLEAIGKNMIEIYPNPASDEIVIELPANHTQAEIKLSDMSGRTLDVHQDVSENVHRLDLRPIPPGVYVVRVTNDGSAVNRLVVKK